MPWSLPIKILHTLNINKCFSILLRYFIASSQNIQLRNILHSFIWVSEWTINRRCFRRQRKATRSLFLRKETLARFSHMLRMFWVPEDCTVRVEAFQTGGSLWGAPQRLPPVWKASTLTVQSSGTQNILNMCENLANVSFLKNKDLVAFLCLLKHLLLIVHSETQIKLCKIFLSWIFWELAIK